jgi:hypothetical protein
MSSLLFHIQKTQKCFYGRSTSGAPYWTDFSDNQRDIKLRSGYSKLPMPQPLGTSTHLQLVNIRIPVPSKKKNIRIPVSETHAPCNPLPVNFELLLSCSKLIVPEPVGYTVQACNFSLPTTSISLSPEKTSTKSLAVPRISRIASSLNLKLTVQCDNVSFPIKI